MSTFLQVLINGLGTGAVFGLLALGFVIIASLAVMGVLTYITLCILAWRMGFRLSLAGVAGLIVTIGFTADSFIVYFERIRDELRDGKSPHWTGSTNSPATFGHFGQSGTFLWVDPELAAACVVLTDRDFGAWAKPLWSEFNDRVVDELSSQN